MRTPPKYNMMPPYTSPLGTYVFSDLNITGDNYTINGQILSFQSIKIPSAIFKVEREHRVVRTEINGMDGEILEYIGTKNWEIDCEVRINSLESQMYPKTDVSNLLLALNSNQPLTVTSWYLNTLFGITNIVILHESEPQVEGELNNQRISFKALSVKPIILNFNTTPLIAGGDTGDTTNS